MGKLSEYLRRPAPLAGNPWQVVVAASLCVFFLLLLILQIRGVTPCERFLIVCGFALVTAASTSVVAYVFPRLFPKFYDPAGWKVWKGLLDNVIILLFISIGNSVFYMIFLGRGEPWLTVFTGMAWSTVIVGIIPMILVTYIIRNADLKRNLRAAEELNSRLGGADRTGTRIGDNAGRITFTGTTKESLEVEPSRILYIESSGNYIIIHYIEEGKVRHGQIRMTVSQAEALLAGVSSIVRSHRAFLVNMGHVTGASGNSQGLQLELSHTGIQIPVSRNYIKPVKENLNTAA